MLERIVELAAMRLDLDEEGDALLETCAAEAVDRALAYLNRESVPEALCHCLAAMTAELYDHYAKEGLPKQVRLGDTAVTYGDALSGFAGHYERELHRFRKLAW